MCCDRSNGIFSLGSNYRLRSCVPLRFYGLDRWTGVGLSARGSATFYTADLHAINTVPQNISEVSRLGYNKDLFYQIPRGLCNDPSRIVYVHFSLSMKQSCSIHEHIPPSSNVRDSVLPCPAPLLKLKGDP